MFESQIYLNRRQQLKANLNQGLILFLGNQLSPMNYRDNAYPFRQDSSFLYYWGLNRPAVAAILDIDNNKEYIIGDDYSIDDMVWIGQQTSLCDLAQSVAVTEVLTWHQAESMLAKKAEHCLYLPQFRDDNIALLQQLIKITKENALKGSSKLINAIVPQRLIKSSAEINEMKEALSITKRMHETAMRNTKAGRVEQEVVAEIMQHPIAKGRELSYPIIFSVHGEILHNERHDNKMQDGQLILHDGGCNSNLGYASDITRCIPVNGRFNTQQKAIYTAVLDMQQTALDMIKPGLLYLDAHLAAAKIAVKHLIELGLMQGDADEAVANGAHALFFPHGLGHAIGLDVHDMEALGESNIGYDSNTKRSEELGVSALRFAKTLQVGYTLTVEPGIYFIPDLIMNWQQQNKLEQFICYDALKDYLDFGGVRIEDNIVVTENGYDNMSQDIIKSIAEVETLMANGD